MQQKYCKYMKWWLDEFCAGDQVDRYVELFPELDSRLSNFAVGIHISRWNTCAGDTGDFLSPEELRKVLGEENYSKLFVKQK